MSSFNDKKNRLTKEDSRPPVAGVNGAFVPEEQANLTHLGAEPATPPRKQLSAESTQESATKSLSTPAANQELEQRSQSRPVVSTAVARGDRPSRSPVVVIVSASILLLAGFLALRGFDQPAKPAPPAGVVKTNPEPAPAPPTGQNAEAAKAAVKAAVNGKPADLRPALSVYAEQNADIRRILAEGWEARNVGGAVAVAVTNFQKNGGGSPEVPERLGFARIKDAADAKALVNLALEDKVDIKSVNVARSPTEEGVFVVTIEVQNRTAYPVTYFIPKGQIVEVKDSQYSASGPRRGFVNAALGAREFKQGAGNSGRERDETVKKTIPPWEPEHIVYTAYCANPNLAPPQGSANLSIYGLEDTSYKDWKELRSIMLDKLRLSPGLARAPQDDTRLTFARRRDSRTRRGDRLALAPGAGRRARPAE